MQQARSLTLVFVETLGADHMEELSHEGSRMYPVPLTATQDGEEAFTSSGKAQL